MRLVQNNNIYKFRAFELRSCDRHIVYMANRFLSPRLLHPQSLMIQTRTVLSKNLTFVQRDPLPDFRELGCTRPRKMYMHGSRCQVVTNAIVLRGKGLPLSPHYMLAFIRIPHPRVSVVVSTF